MSDCDKLIREFQKIKDDIPAATLESYSAAFDVEYTHN